MCSDCFGRFTHLFIPHDVSGLLDNFNPGRKGLSRQPSITTYGQQQEAFQPESYNSYASIEGTGNPTDVYCVGCQKYGHHSNNCFDSYRCQACYGYHLKGVPCPSKNIGGDIQRNRGQDSSDSVAAPRGGEGDGDTTSNGAPYTLPTAYKSLTTPAKYPPPSHAPQPQQYTRQAEGHVTHTVTHTVTEVGSILLRTPPYPFPRIKLKYILQEVLHDRDRETDDRPWFQLMKRRRSSVIETVDRGKSAPSSFDYNDDDYPPEHYGELVKTDDAATPQRRSVHPKEYSVPNKYANFRSGLDILLDSEKQ